MESNTSALLDALNLLISSDDAKHLYNSLATAAALRIVHPVWSAGEESVLNPLLHVARTNPERFKFLIGKVDQKRREALLAPLVEEQQDGFDKTAYMRDFMYQKRVRMRRAAEIENSRRAPKDALVGRSRLDFMDAQAARWKTELDRRIEAARKAHGSRLPKDIDRTVREQFWTWVDEHLDAEAAAVPPVRRV